MESLEFVEKINESKLNQLLTLGNNIEFNGEKIWETELLKLIKFSKLVKKGILKVKYKQAKYNKGRLYSCFNGSSLQGLWRPLRHTLSGEFYYDVDIKNCHPVLLQQLAEKHSIINNSIKNYNENRDHYLEILKSKFDTSRDNIKMLICRIFFGGKIETWINENEFNLDILDDPELKFLKNMKNEVEFITKKIYEIDPYNLKSISNTSRDPNITKKTYNKESRLLSITLQEMENLILLKLKELLEKDGFIIGVPMFDGAQIENNKPLNNDMLKIYSDKIEESLKYKVEFLIKPMNDIIEIEKLISNHGIKELSDEHEAAEFLLELHGKDKIKYFHNLYFFDNSTGLWVSDPVLIRNIILNYKSQLKKYCLGKHYEEMIKNLKSISIDNIFFKKSELSSLNYLLFNNGYYDMKKNIFYDKETYEFNPNIVFYKKINRDFIINFEENEEIKKYINTVKTSIFDNITNSKQESEFLILSLAQALAGPTKNIFFMIGDGNNGKSILSSLLGNSLDEYFNTFNAGNFIYKKGGSDEAQRLRWSFLNRHSRIIFSNEVRSATGEGLDADEMKKHSGLDKLTARLHGKNEEEYTPHYTCFIGCNDAPKIEGMDDAFKNRLKVLNLPFAFKMVSSESELKKEKNEKMADIELSTKINNDEYKEGTLYLLLQTYKEFINGKIKFEQPKEMIKYAGEWFESSDFETILNEKFEITNKETDFIPCKDIIDFLTKTKKISWSNTKIGIKLNKLVKSEFKGSIAKQCEDKIIRNCRIGIRERKEEETITEIEEPINDSEIINL
jgi:hypothetical protein